MICVNSAMRTITVDFVEIIWANTIITSPPTTPTHDSLPTPTFTNNYYSHSLIHLYSISPVYTSFIYNLAKSLNEFVFNNKCLWHCILSHAVIQS